MAFRATAKIDLDPLEKERRTIDRRRTDDENRRQRILDVKQRTFGVRQFRPPLCPAVSFAIPTYRRLLYHAPICVFLLV